MKEKKEEEEWPLFETEEYGGYLDAGNLTEETEHDWPLFEAEADGGDVPGITLPVRTEDSPTDDVKLEREQRDAVPKDDVKKLEPEENALGYEPTSPAVEEPEEPKIEVAKAQTLDDVQSTELATELGPPSATVLRRRHLQPAVDESDLHLTDVGWETTAVPLRRAPPPPLRVPRVTVDEKVVPCPALLVGSKLDKACPLRPGRWVEVGRNPKAHVLLQNPAVSKHHCKLLWKRGSSAVELRVLDGITHVNDRRLQLGSAMSLKHGDLMKIHGKDVSFRLLVDMQPVDLKLPSVRTLPNFSQKDAVKAPPPRSQEDELRRKIKQFKALADAAKEKAMLSEQRLTQIQTRRKLRSMEIEESLEKSKHFEKDERRLEEILVKSRDEWLERLQSQSEKHHKDARPLTQITSDTQTKLGALQELKESIEIKLHPERRQDVIKPSADAADDDSDSESKKGEADGEEEAFPDAPTGGVKDDKLKDEKMDKPSIEVLPTAPTGADADVADLFGDFDSDDNEPLAASIKRPAPDEETEPSL